MGVPKFFRYISERYPCLSEFVKEYQIPVFDNLYLDMNGIIHMCSHPDDGNPHFRITEEKIFSDIFHYIEVLFRMIKPQKVFFMAIDGVAPRAKMNQQRGRRFRSSKDAEKLEKEAIRKGEKLPDAERFDSNCITPGTEFMARLHAQLKYFVVKKISSDKMWRNCKVILSGHETPGEGEHKIMDYIRYIRAQPGYDPNTRHCLYGLDADLIMLGLCTHDPHFSLLREEVKFGKKTRHSSVPEEIRFYLLHLSLMREYLELEFASLKEQLQGKFDIEKIIDDWILMGFLVGNDFIPHLPNLHIANGALPILYKAYMEVLPTLDGYINEAGTLNLDRFEKFMKELASIDFKNFEETCDDMLYMEKKTGRKQNFHTPVHSKLTVENNFDSKECPEQNRDPALAALIAATDELDVSSDDNDDDESFSNEDEKFKSFKDEYYRNKLEYRKITSVVMREQAEGYVRAIQWNLHYYYNGVCSWSWFYPHHYAPYISDIKGFSNKKIDFELGKPFKPYEQLLAVLPPGSKNLLPKCYHSLMTDENSIIKAYYPEDFQTDLNGKRQEWEAVVLVPFIDENNLLEAMESCNKLLSLEEAGRNQHGPMLVYEYAHEDLGIYQAPSHFPDIENHAQCTPIDIEVIRVPKEMLVKGAYPGAKFDVFYPGFPTLKHLKYGHDLQKAKVKVFEVPSRSENLILKILPSELDFGDEIPLELLGTTVWVGWPHLVEAKVTAISNRKKKYVVSKTEEKGYKIEEQPLFDSELEGVVQRYKERMGIEFGRTEVLIHVQLMIGRRYAFTSGRRVNLEKQFSNIMSNYPLQSIVANISVHDECHSTYVDVNEVFPEETICFSLTQPHYGAQGIVMDSQEALKNNYLKICLHLVEEPDLHAAQKIDDKLRNDYLLLTNAASRVCLSNYVFSRITGTLYVSVRNTEGSLKSTNIGLNLKFNKRNEETPGYTKKKDNVWVYTENAVVLVGRYVEKFPEIFIYLARSNSDEIIADDVFKDDAEEKVKSIQTWLKTLPTYNIERRVWGSAVLEQDVVMEIEKIIDQMQKSSKEIVMQMKPQMLYKPGMQTGNLAPDPDARTKTFDRIVNIREGFTVPLGLKGTIIAVHKPTNAVSTDEIYDVVFDMTFSGGMSLNCSNNRGYRLPKTAFINLTYGKRQMKQKTGAAGSLRILSKDRYSATNTGNVSCDNAESSTSRSQSSAFASFNKVPSNFVSQSPQSKIFHYNSILQHPRSQQYVNAPHDSPQKMKNSFYEMADYTKMYQPKINKENTVTQKNTANSGQNYKVAKRATSASQKQSQPREADVNTDFLKKILNIQNASNNSESNLQKRNETRENHPKPFNKRGQDLNANSATARLLSYYQSHLWGCPRYTYLEEEDGFSAQLVLPNGKAIYGRTARTRESASDNVALDALNMFQNEKSKLSDEGLPSQFPEPPTKWVQTRQPQNKMPTQVFTNKSHQIKSPSHNISKMPGNVQKPARVSTNLHTPSFVPLQALKRPTNKNVNFASRTASNSQSSKMESTTFKPSTHTTDSSKGHGVNTKNKQEQPGRSRKTRIAANFNQ